MKLRHLALALIGLIALGMLFERRRPAGAEAPTDATATAARPRAPVPARTPSSHAGRARAMLGGTGLTADERRAVDAAIDRKFAVRGALSGQVASLFERAMDEAATDEQVAQAVEEYLRIKADCRRKVEEIDDELVAKVSTRTRAKLLTSGILDNGLGFMAGRRPEGATLPSMNAGGHEAARHDPPPPRERPEPEP